MTESCSQCLRPEDICVCDRIEAISTKHNVLVLQHPREQDIELGSAKLLAMMLPKCVLKVGLSWPSLSKAWGKNTEASHWAVVFPRPNVQFSPDTNYELSNRSGKTVSPSKIRGIILLDGTWSQAKSLWWRNPWLLKSPRLTLSPKEPSIYGAVRTEPRKQYISTIEAAGAALYALGEPEIIDKKLKRVFRTLLQRYRDQHSSDHFK
ncbi:MAG: DTW domain-containing protein [Deltaproteobacteria bacterium]|nr:DTW domain-containing protein [Deltaproteobacteria bacterium]